MQIGERHRLYLSLQENSSYLKRVMYYTKRILPAHSPKKRQVMLFDIQESSLLYTPTNTKTKSKDTDANASQLT